MCVVCVYRVNNRLLRKSQEGQSCNPRMRCQCSSECNIRMASVEMVLDIVFGRHTHSVEQALDGYRLRRAAEYTSHALKIYRKKHKHALLNNSGCA
jgi:hypothetical protein